MLNQHYTTKRELVRHNRPKQLHPILGRLLLHKPYARIADIGSGPYCKLGDSYPGTEIELLASDHKDFADFWARHGGAPWTPVHQEDMEHLSYLTNYFDLTHCANALDHTRDAKAAILEMIRVTKPESFVYICCNLYQKNTGFGHRWNATETGILENGSDSFDLKWLGFKITHIPGGSEPRYDRIVAVLQKPASPPKLW